MATVTGSKIIIPSLPKKIYSNDRYLPEVIEMRRRDLESFLMEVSSHPIIQAHSTALISFLQVKDSRDYPQTEETI